MRKGKSTNSICPQEAIAAFVPVVGLLGNMFGGVQQGQYCCC